MQKQVQFGRYTLLGLVARGGMGEIYHAQLQGVAGFEKHCIIKKIRRELASMPSFIERFLNEGRTLVALTHSNIVQIFDMGEVEGEYYLAMEYVQGADLRVLLRRIKPQRVPLNVAIAVTIEALRGLGYAHRATDAQGAALGIVHGDMSPSNVIISKEGEVKLIDFGIARGVLATNSEGAVQGKFAYMSPEQARGEVLDLRSDLFSTGVVLYEMLSGERPFEHNAQLSCASAAVFGDYPPLSHIHPEVDAPFDALIAKALATPKSARYENAEDFLDALVHYAQSHALSCGQREIVTYFRPMMAEDTPICGATADEVMSSALDALLLGQQFNETQTHTLAPLGETPRPEPSSKETENSTPASTQAENSDSLSTQAENSDSPILIASSSPSAENTTDEASEIWDRPQKRRSRLKRFGVRLRYVFIGILLALLGSTMVWFYYTRQYTPAQFEKLRDTFYEIRNGGDDFMDKRPENDIPPQPKPLSGYAQYLENTRQPMKFENFTRQSRSYFLGVSFAFYTEPEEATIYIVEGTYRALEGKQFVLAADDRFEMAIQAPGYATCLYRVLFDDNGKFDRIESHNCESVTSVFSLRTQRMEVLISLEPIRVQREAEMRDSTAETTVEPKMPNAQETPQEKAAAPKKERKTRVQKQTPSSSEPPQKQEKLKFGAKANRDATLRIGERMCDLPCELEGEANEAFAIRPKESGRTIGMAQTGRLSKNEWRDVRFCDLTIRIAESYIADDPAPYQAADIYVDGVLAVQQVERAHIVTTCGPHEIKAQTLSNFGKLTGNASVKLDVGEPVLQTVHLSLQ